MFESLLTQPQLIELPQGGCLTLTLSEAVSDSSLLQTMAGHIAEWVVVEGTANKVSLVVRIHPFLKFDIQSNYLDEVNPIGAHQINRSLGQGVRLFNAVGYSPSICASLLRQGLVIRIIGEQHGNVGFIPLFDCKWQLVELERDFRLFGAPRELRRAKSILARETDFQLSAEKLLLEINEIEIVRNELRSFADIRQIHHHSVILSEITSLDTQLLRRKQLVLRLYHQTLDRVNWQNAANQVDDIEVLQRKIESYQLLAPPELNAMVEQMFVDESD